MPAQLTPTNPIPCSRREWLAASIAATTAFAWSSAPAKAASDPKNKATSPKGLFRVRCVLDVNGEIRLKSQTNDTAGKNGKTLAAKTAPLKATSTVDFDEQFETTKNLSGCRSYQFYHEATSEIQIDRHVTKTTLREQCRDILRTGTDEGIMSAAPDNPLFAAERDLIEGPINTMFLDEILTEREVRIADKWTIGNDSACRLLNMDAIQDGKLTVCLVDVDQEKAQLEISGTLSASVRQVPTTLAVEGKAQMDRKDGYISWLAVNIAETREISESQPGFRVEAQVRILRSSINAMTSGQSLDQVAARVGNINLASLLQFQSDLGYYRFIADRKWATYRDSGEEATLRYVRDNRVIAQCNVTNMIDFEPGRQLSLEGFQADVKNAIGNALVEVVEGAERLSSNKHRLLRVVSRGGTQGVNIQWIHYHISNDDGRRIVLAFTLNEANMEFFAAEDAQIADTFELINWPTKLDAKAIESAVKEKEKEKSPTKPDAPANVSSRQKLPR